MSNIMYNVFISCKSEDYSKAEPVYHWLVEKGYRPFFSPISLKIAKTPGEPVVFGDEIDDALEQVNNMIVFASDADYVKTGYVKDEWRTFVEEQRAGRKSGSLVTVLDGIDVSDLPIRLRSVQSFTPSNYKEGMLRFLKNTQAQEDNNVGNMQMPKKVEHNSADKLPFIVNGVPFKMISVQGGTFKMGAQSKDQNSDNYNADAENNESPVHKVSLNDYYIGETLVTQALWKAVMGTNPSFCKGDNLPVEQVSWNDCQKFIQNLNALTGETFHLPTEAEWEYAARGGKNSRGYKFAGGNSIGDVAWYRDNYADIAHPVKTKCPNELGIYDMSGSVCEWCDDGFENYSSVDQINPRGSSFASDHVLRGGSRVSGARDCRVTNREFSTDSPNRYIGFRLVLKKNTDESDKTLNVGNVKFKMIHVQGGTFLMGAQKEDTSAANYSNDAYIDESPIHEVTLDEYYIGETEVTQALWKEVMGTEPTRNGGWTEELGRGDNYPVYWVSWNDCQEFIRKLNAKTGKTFRLPTEAEWEYAARGGNQHQDNKYAGGSVIDDVAWYTDNSDNKTHPVKCKWPNELGLYDMSGNVWEWCQDWFSQSYYGESPSHNPVCQSGGLTRVLRGGSFHDFPRGCRVTVRGDFNSERHSRYHGLRLVLSHL